MEKKNFMFFTLAILGLLLVGSISASADELASVDYVQIDDLDADGSDDIAVTAGELLTVEVAFTALEDASDVRMEVEIDGTKKDVSVKSSPFVVEDGKRYVKRLTIRVPYELEDEVSDDLYLNIEIWNGDYETELDEITLRVQRPGYNADIMSIETAHVVEAGETIPVDVVVKNVGYNKLDDLYVTLRIPELGIQRTSYFGDIVATECYDDDGYCDEDDEDNERGRFYVKIPYEAKEGIYTLEVIASNDDLTLSESAKITIENEVSEYVIVSTVGKTGSVGEDVVYDLLLVNPTDKLKVYKVVTQSSGDVSVSTDTPMVAVASGSSKSVQVTARANSEGEHQFDVSVFSGDNLVKMVTLTENAERRSINNAATVLVVILAIVFIVLLVVLIVLLGKRPEKSEELESYY